MVSIDEEKRRAIAITQRTTEQDKYIDATVSRGVDFPIVDRAKQRRPAAVVVVAAAARVEWVEELEEDGKKKSSRTFA
jgi:hypothetical protein